MADRYRGTKMLELANLAGRAGWVRLRPIADVGPARHNLLMNPTGRKWMPLWAQRLQWLFFASFVVWFGFLIFGDPFEHSYIAMSLFAGMLVPASVRAYFMMHAVARGEINPFTTLSTRKMDE